MQNMNSTLSRVVFFKHFPKKKVFGGPCTIYKIFVTGYFVIHFLLGLIKHSCTIELHVSAKIEQTSGQRNPLKNVSVLG